MGIKIVQGVKPKSESAPIVFEPLPPLFTEEQARRMLMATMKLVAINQTPGLMERWAAGQKLGGVVCPECGGDWDAWIAREKRRKEQDLLPWEVNS